MQQRTLMPWPRFACGSVFLCLVLGFAIPDAVAQERTKGKLEWVDVHVHPMAGRGGDYASAFAAAIAAMDEAGIRKMVLLPPPQVRGNQMFDFETLVTAVKGNSARFSFLGGGGSLNLMLHEAAKDGGVSAALRSRFEERANQILAAGAAGFGEIAVHHLALRPGHPYESVAADHPLLLALADIAARHDAIIDVHFDPVAADGRIPAWGSAFDNPAELRANLPGFERLLEHNRKARIVWAHAGSDMLGFWTPELSRRLLAKHANLNMSLRVDFGRAPQNHPVDSSGKLKAEWLQLFTEFPDRFVIGGDQFIFAPGPGGLPGFAQRAPIVREKTRALLEQLPPELAQKIGIENAIRLYRLK